MRVWLRDIRKKAGMTQGQVSDSAGISRPAYTRIENGTRGLSVGTAKKIADVFAFNWIKFYEDK